MASYTMYEDMMSKEARDFDNVTDDDMRELNDLMKSPYPNQAFSYYFGAPINGPAQDAGSEIKREAAPNTHNSLKTGFEMLPEDSDNLFENIPPVSPSFGLVAAVIKGNSAVVSDQAAMQGRKWHTLQGLEHNVCHKSLLEDDSLLYPTSYVPDYSPLSFHTPAVDNQGNVHSQTLRVSKTKAAFGNTPYLSPAETSQIAAEDAAAPELDKQQCLELLTAGFKNLASCKGTPREVTFIKKTTNSDINKWCRELYEYSLQRTQNKSSTLPPRPKRGGCHNSPEYLTNSDRVRAIANVLHDDKRACFRFNGDNSWSHKLADDPMWQRDAICTNDKGNSDKARRAQQSKDNATTIVQVLRDLRQVLLGAPSDMTVEILLERFDHIEKLAVYIQDPPKADQEAGNPLARGRGKRTNNPSEESATELESLEKDALLSPYTTRATPSSVNQQMRNTHLGESSSKKRRLTDAHGIPGTPTPSRKVYPTIIPSSPQMAQARPYADPSVGLKARSPVSDTVTAEAEVRTSQPSPVLPPGRLHSTRISFTASKKSVSGMYRNGRISCIGSIRLSINSTVTSCKHNARSPPKRADNVTLRNSSMIDKNSAFDVSVSWTENCKSMPFGVSKIGSACNRLLPAKLRRILLWPAEIQLRIIQLFPRVTNMQGCHRASTSLLMGVSNHSPLSGDQSSGFLFEEVGASMIH